jgi:hypothetical protein
MQLQWHGRSPTNRFCRWIVVCFMCAHEISYVYSHVCVKAPCFDDNLVHYLHISVFGTFSRQSSSKVPTGHVTVWFCEPKFCERKRTCLVGALCNVIGILSTTYKVCVMRCYTLCGIAQGSCRDRSPWAYLYDPRSGAHYSSWRWVGVLRQLHLTPGILDSDAGTPLSTLSLLNEFIAKIPDPKNPQSPSPHYALLRKPSICVSESVCTTWIVALLPCICWY